MNTNNTLPTITTSRDDQERESWVTFEWIGGTGERRFGGLNLNLDAHEGGQDGIVQWLNELIAHTFLMGYEAHEVPQPAAVDVDDRSMHTECDRSIAELGVDRDGLQVRNQRQMERIESMLAEHASVVEQGRILLESRARRISELEAALATAEQAVAERSEERDAMADGLNGLQRDLIVGTSPEWAKAVEEGVVAAYQDGFANGMADEPVNPHPEGSVLHGHWALGGYNRREFGQRNVQIEALGTQVREGRELIARHVTTIEEQGRRNVYLQGRCDSMMTEWEHVAQSLLEEAERRSWCREYEEWASGVNARTRYFKLELRTKEYNVTFNLDVDPIMDGIEDADLVYDTSVERDATVYASATITCHEDEIETKVTAMKRTFMQLRHVNDVSADWDESDG